MRAGGGCTSMQAVPLRGLQPLSPRNRGEKLHAVSFSRLAFCSFRSAMDFFSFER